MDDGRTIELPANAEHASWNGLLRGETHTFALAARYALGLGRATVQTFTIPFSAPNAPRATGLATANSATLVWHMDSDDDGGKPITGFTVQMAGTAPIDVGKDVSSFTWTGLQPVHAYTFSVRASNEIGTGPASTVTLTTGAGVPSAPTALQVRPADDGTSAAVTWSAPESDGGAIISGYRVTVSGFEPVTLGSTMAHTWTDLTPGVTYTFSVRAINGVGQGPPASLEVTTSVPSTTTTPPLTTPAAATMDAPTLGAPTSGRPGGPKTATFTWTRSRSTDGADPVAYIVQVLRHGLVIKSVRLAPTKTFFRFRTTRPGRYRAVVTAIDARGPSASSAPSAPVVTR